MKTRLLLFFLLSAATKLCAQIGFQENIIAGAAYTTFGARYIQAADIDGDGDQDIVAYGNGLNWYENMDGLGNFGAKKVIAGTYTSPVGTSLSIIDLDGDGDSDLLTSVNNTFTTYKNTNGLGSFQIIQSFTLGINSSTPLSVIPADMDGDNDLDVVSIYATSNNRFLVWYPNNGLGTVGAEQVISSDSSLTGASSLLIKDLDGDHHDDIIIGNKSYGKISWMKNNGNGTYGTPVNITTSVSGVSSIVASDMDQDGDMDIVSSTAYDNQVSWFKNLDGLGSFGGENILLTNTTASNAVIVTDVNNDNTADVIYTKTNEIGWLSNNGAGVFGGEQLISNKAFGLWSVTMADLDGDGIKDLVSASEDDDKVAWYKRDLSGNFGRQLVISRRLMYPNNVYSGDFDGDQDIDLLANSQHDAKLTWFENVNGLGFYGKEHVITEQVDTGNLTPYAYPVDVDGDGDLDIAALKDAAFLWYANDGHGNFTEHTINSTSSGMTLIRAQDMDGDGDQDLVCGFYSSSVISWYKNLGSGNFSAQIIISPADSGGLTSLQIADMDGDGDMDIIASDYGWDMYYFKNTNGLGSFALQNLTVFASMYAVYPGDMDGDGDNDIVGISTSGGTLSYAAVAWFENNNGDFEVSHNISAVSTSGESIQVVDIDHDGDLDVLTAENKIIAWYSNNGNGTFGARQIIHQVTDFTEAQCVAVGDVDHDNDSDVLGVYGYDANWTVGKVSVFNNLGLLGNNVHGTVRVDANANGCSNDDVKGQNFMVISNNGSHSFATFTDENGAYSTDLPTGSFTTAISPGLPAYFSANPASYTLNFAGLNNTQQADFCIAPMGTVNDVNITAYPTINNVRTGTETYYRIVYKNVGTTTANGTVTFEYNNNKINFLMASQATASQTANTLTFDFAHLNPFETRTIDLKFHVFAPPVTNINDDLVSVARINAILTDATTDDNSFSLNQVVTGSYDPNDITCLEGNQVLIQDADKYLHYLIRFQNTGTASALNIRIENALDSKLDWTSMQLESLSHRGKVEINDGTEMKFIFNDIHLPASSIDEANSHGFIAYKIKPLSNVVVGNVIHNTANIYFDYNPAITTNTAATQFVENLSVAQIDVNSFKIYPNPTTSLLNMTGNAMIDQVDLIDINGRLLKDFRFNSPTSFAQIDLTGLTHGIYFLKIKSNLGTVTKKIMKR